MYGTNLSPKIAVNVFMDNTLIMDVSGAWVRKPMGSNVRKMNQWADEKERLFLAKYPPNVEEVDEEKEKRNCKQNTSEAKDQAVFP